MKVVECSFVLYFLFLCLHSKAASDDPEMVHISLEGDVKYHPCLGCPRMLNSRLYIRSFCKNENYRLEADVWFSFSVVGHEVHPGKGGILLEIDDLAAANVSYCATGRT